VATAYRALDQAAPERPSSSSPLAALGRLLDRLPRLVRFGTVGCTCAAFQLVALELLVRLGTELHAANVIAFLISTQVNFCLSSVITWRDRRVSLRQPVALLKRLAGYNVLALGSLLINQTVFAIALPNTHYLVAAALGILSGMLLTYAVSAVVLFRRRIAVPGELPA
jgi:putative flippase GtrA